MNKKLMEPFNKGGKMVFTKYLFYLEPLIPLDDFKSNDLIKTSVIGFKEIKYNTFSWYVNFLSLKATGILMYKTPGRDEFWWMSIIHHKHTECY